MYHFFVKPHQINMNDKSVIIEGQDVNHIQNVLRMQIGEELAVGNGEDDKEYRVAIKEFQKETILCDLLFVKENDVELPSRIYLFQGLPKADKMELIIQKAVELGVYEVIPVETARSIVKLEAKKKESKIARWQEIAKAAAKQSKRGIIPEVKMPMTFKEAVQYAAQSDVKLIPYELALGMDTTRKYMESIKQGQSVAVFIGPEGGFDTKEIEMAKDFGIEPITLGRRILRTETAGLTILSWLMYHLERE